ncbi:MAG: type 3 dihydrofolate reductase [Sulfurimonadaceae bacterium]
MKIPKISIIVAMAKNRVIGKDNDMPWHLPADLQHFRQMTLNRPIIMGRKTYESIGRPLPKRHNIIISRNVDYKVDGCDVVSSLDKAVEVAGEVEEIFIIGGGFLYNQTIDQADRLYLTFIDLDVEGDTLFPEYEHLSLKKISSEHHQKDEKNPYDYEFAEFVIDK